ncbi:MAG: hypothetical protein IKX26_07610 [Bacteroidales bacterium]|nr:hypothetical protein [Bacteroidales bacterium]
MDSIVFLGFNLYAWITIVTVLAMFSVLIFTKLRADVVFLAAIGILLVAGVVDEKEAFSGFSSSSTVVVGVTSAGTGKSNRSKISVILAAALAASACPNGRM